MMETRESVTVRCFVLLRDWGPRRAGEIIKAGVLDPQREVALLESGFMAAELEEADGEGEPAREEPAREAGRRVKKGGR